MRLNTLIADDEPLARERLRLLLSEDQEFFIAGECRNGREVLTALQENHCDVLFLDIEMPGSNAFEIIEQVGVSHMPVTIFVTAHNHYAVQAFEVQALDYLTKPVELERIKTTLVRVKERLTLGSRRTQAQLESVLAALKDKETLERRYLKRLVVPSGTRNTFVSVDDIDWIEAADYYSCLHVGTKNLLLRETIKQLAQTLDPRRFIRVHRSAIVNIDRVREILREGRDEGCVLLANGIRVKMSKAGWHNLLAASRP